VLAHQPIPPVATSSDSGTDASPTESVQSEDEPESDPVCGSEQPSIIIAALTVADASAHDCIDTIESVASPSDSETDDRSSEPVQSEDKSREATEPSSRTQGNFDVSADAIAFPAVVDAAVQSAIIVNKEAVSEADNQASLSVPSPGAPGVNAVADSIPIESEPQVMDDLAEDDVNESEQQNLKEAENNAMDAVQLEGNGLAIEEPELDAPAQDESKVEVTNKPESDELSSTIASQVEAQSGGQTSSATDDDANQESQHDVSQPSLPPSISSITDFAMIDMSGASNVTSEASQLDNHADMGAPTTMSEDVLIADQAEAPTDLDMPQIPAEDSMTVEEAEDDAPVNEDQAGAETYGYPAAGRGGQHGRRRPRRR
jgi:hypothetical protein